MPRRTPTYDTEPRPVRARPPALWRAGLACAAILAVPAWAQNAPADAPAPTPAPAAALAETPLIPRAVLFGNPERLQARLSPDGAYLSYLAPRGGALNVWVAPADAADEATPVTDASGPGIRDHVWAHTSRHILYVRDRDGDENWRLHAADVRTGRSIDLTPFDGVQARVLGLDRDDPERVLVGLNRRDPRLHDLYSVNITTGELSLLEATPPDAAGWVLDDRGRPRFVVRLTPDGGAEMLAPVAGAPADAPPEARWAPEIVIPREDLLTTQALAFDETGRELLMLDSRGRDTSALVAFDVDTGVTRTIASDAGSDISGVLLHPTTHKVQAVATNRLRPRWRAVDPEATPDLMALERAGDGAFSVVSKSDDDRRWVVVLPDDDGPARYALYDRAERVLTPLFVHDPALADWPLQPMRTVVVTARDGLELVSYLTLPPHAEADVQPGAGLAGGDEVSVAGDPLPLVLLVHGGPWARDAWGYAPVHQLLANRGYAVLSVNFRGSTGFGKRFVNAGDREWGGKMQDDLSDAVAWAIQRGIADADRVAIMGASYGGYAALMGLTRDPDLYAAGVSLVGPSSLITLLESIPPYFEPLAELWRTRVGDVRTPEGRAFLEARSPLSRVSAIRAPLLLGHGANDPRVLKAESDAIAEAVKERGAPVVYALFPDEGHGLSRPSNRIAFFALAEHFLARELGGRAEPLDGVLDASSAVLEMGGPWLLQGAAAPAPPGPADTEPDAPMSASGLPQDG